MARAHCGYENIMAVFSPALTQTHEAQGQAWNNVAPARNDSIPPITWLRVGVHA